MNAHNNLELDERHRLLRTATGWELHEQHGARLETDFGTSRTQWRILASYTDLDVAELDLKDRGVLGSKAKPPAPVPIRRAFHVKPGTGPAYTREPGELIEEPTNGSLGPAKWMAYERVPTKHGFVSHYLGALDEHLYVADGVNLPALVTPTAETVQGELAIWQVEQAMQDLKDGRKLDPRLAKRLVFIALTSRCKAKHDKKAIPKLQAPSGAKALAPKDVVGPAKGQAKRRGRPTMMARWLKLMGKTQAQAARELGKSPQYIGQLVRGEKALPALLKRRVQLDLSR